MKRHSLTAVLAMILGIGVMVYAGAELSKVEHVYSEGNSAYSDISGRVRKVSGHIANAHSQSPSNSADSSQGRIDTLVYEETKTKNETETKKPHVDIPAFDIDYDALTTINKDAVAWLYCPDTVIDYPVMQADDYSYYLNHLPDGTKNANGTLFIDYNNASDFSDPLTVIYGHHMKSGKMFGNLKGYKEQRYYEDHPYMYLYTQTGNYRIDLIYGCVIGASQWRERAFMYSENIDALLAYAEHNTTFQTDVTYAEGDRFVALSTCSYEFDNARYVVIGVLREG